MPDEKENQSSNTPKESNPNTISTPRLNETSMPDIKGNSGTTNDGGGIIDTPIFKGNGIDIPSKEE